MSEAVSSMVSAVLVLAIFTAAFGVWTVDTVPEWIAAREHAHASEVAASFADMRGNLDTMPSDGRSASFTLDLAPDPIPLLQRAPAFGEAVVVSGSEGFHATLAMTNEQLVAVGGVMVAAPATPPTGAASAPWNAVASLLAIEIFLEDTAGGGPGDRVLRVTATENDGTRTASITATKPNASTVCTVQTHLGSTSLGIVELECSTDLRINALSDQFRFKGALAQLDADYSLTFDDLGQDIGMVSAAFFGTDGLPRSFGTTAASDDQDQSISSSAVVFIPNYLEIEDRSVRFDGGGIVNIQREVAAFAVEPAFAIDTISGEGFVRWTIVDLDGSGSLSGSNTAAFEFRKLATKDLLVRTAVGGSDTVFSVTTPASAAWEDMWVDALALEAIPSSQASVAQVGETASLTLDASIPWTIHLTIHDVELSVT